MRIAARAVRLVHQQQAGLPQLHVCHDVYHEIVNETAAARPLAGLRAWLAAQEAL